MGRTLLDSAFCAIVLPLIVCCHIAVLPCYAAMLQQTNVEQQRGAEAQPAAGKASGVTDGQSSTGPGIQPLRLAGDWPQFRGPSGTGVAAAECNPPLEWSPSKNILWKVKLTGEGWSSPVIDRQLIWLTATTDKRRSLRVLAYDAQTGAERFNTEVFKLKTPGQIHSKNTHASPSPLIVGDRVFVHFGAHGTAAVSVIDASPLWQIELPYYHHHGPAASPVWADDTLVIICDGHTGPFWDSRRRDGVSSPQFAAGIDPASGDQRWLTERKNGRHSYATPLAINHAGRSVVIAPGGDGVTAYDPKTGRQLWFLGYTGYSVVPRPVVANNRIIISTGYDSPKLLAINPPASRQLGADDSNEIEPNRPQNNRPDIMLGESDIAWSQRQGAPLSTSPVVCNDLLFAVTDAGVVSCWKTDDGKLQWKRRIGGNFSASPICAAGRVYFASENGTVTVIAAENTFKQLAVNKLPESIYASPACVGNRLYIRGEEHLYCIGEKLVDDGAEKNDATGTPKSSDSKSNDAQLPDNDEPDTPGSTPRDTKAADSDERK